MLSNLEYVATIFIQGLLDYFIVVLVLGMAIWELSRRLGITIATAKGIVQEDQRQQAHAERKADREQQRHLRDIDVKNAK